MLTTLVIATTVTTGAVSVGVLATMDHDAENHWDPRTQLRVAAHLARSCLQRSQLMVSGCWSHVSRAGRGLTQRLDSLTS
jgi:hypothetical protein